MDGKYIIKDLGLRRVRGPDRPEGPLREFFFLSFGSHLFCIDCYASPQEKLSTVLTSVYGKQQSCMTESVLMAP